MANHPDPNDLTEVFSAFDPTLVQMARDRLSEAGIECFVFDSEASEIFGNSLGSRLMVYGDNAEDALSRLKELGFLE